MPVCAENVVRRFLAKQVTYVGVLLNRASQQKLIHWWNKYVKIPLHPEIFAHHMTIKFMPTPEEVQAFPIGERRNLKVIGWAADDKGQAVLVVPQGIESDYTRPHITMACAPGTGAVYSNELLAQGVHRVNGPMLTGTIDTR
jgi:hypothetical protein